MKNVLFALLALSTIFSGYGQDITGKWNGLLKQIGLRVVFHIYENENDFSSTLDIPDQGATGIPVTSTFFENDSLKIKISNLGVTYNTKLIDDSFQKKISHPSV